MGRKSETPKTENPNKGLTKKELWLLWDMLRRKTDPEHPMSGKDICAWMESEGMPHSMDKMAEDLRLLESLKSGAFEKTHQGTSENYYYVGDSQRLFKPSELKLMIDALQASSAIPAELTDDLAARLLTLTSDHQARSLQQEMTVFNPHKTANRFVIDNIEELSKARRLGMQATFRYFYLDEKKKPVFQREIKGEPCKAPYTVEPQELVYRDDNYYLIAWDCDRQRLAHFRVDRMKRVICTDTPVEEADGRMEEDLEDYTRQVFSMFGGEKSEITLRLHDLKAISIIYDHFGEETQIRRKGRLQWETTVSVQLSPQLWGWLCGCAGLISLVGPKDVIKQYRAWFLGKVIDEFGQS